MLDWDVMRVVALVLLVSWTAACGRAELPVLLESGTGGHVAGVGGSDRERAACGNGVVDPGEECDGPRTASSCIEQGFRGGVLRCDRACRLDVSACVKPQPTAAEACPVPAAPIALPPGCLDDLCACDRPALLNCGMDCWLAVACRVATCTNNPTRPECANGCPNSSSAELSLGQCYESSRACTR